MICATCRLKSRIREYARVEWKMGAGIQQLRLQDDSVPVPTGKLEHGLHTPLLQEMTEGKGPHAHDGPRPIGDIDRIRQGAIFSAVRKTA